MNQWVDRSVVAAHAENDADHNVKWSEKSGTIIHGDTDVGADGISGGKSRTTDILVRRKRNCKRTSTTKHRRTRMSVVRVKGTTFRVCVRAAGSPDFKASSRESRGRKISIDDDDVDGGRELVAGISIVERQARSGR